MTNLVLIPGLITDETLWDEVVRSFKKSYTIHFANLANYSTIDDMAKSLHPHMENDVFLVGFSMGSWVALNAYYSKPDTCKGLILISSTPGALSQTLKQRFSEYLQQITAGHFDSFIEHDFVRDFSLENAQNATLKEVFIKMAKCQGPEAAIRQLNAMLNFKEDYSDLSDIQCPVLLMRGEQDVSLNLPRHEKMFQEIPNASLSIIPNASHYLPFESPQLIAQVIETWIEQSN